MNNRLLGVLKTKPFLYLWLAEIFSQIAMNMINFVLIIVAFKVTNSNTAVAGIVLSFTIPAILFGMVAGVYVDRWNKKQVLTYTNVIRAVLLILLIFGFNNITIIYIISFLVATVTQFFIPAETPLIPRVVKKEYLLSANALFGMGIYGSIPIAYILSGILLLFFGEVTSFIILALLFLIATVFIRLVEIPPAEKDPHELLQEPAPSALSREMKHAFSLILKTKAIYHSLFLLAFSQIFVLILGVVGPSYARQVMGIKVDEFPLLFITPAAIGMLLGAVILGNYFHHFSKQKSATVGVLLAGLGMLLLPFGSRVESRAFIHTVNNYLPNFLDVTTLHITIFLAFILGVANALVFVPSNTILQEETSDEFRGRVYGALNAMVGVLSLIPIVVVGELADVFGVARVITGIGVVILAIGILRIPTFAGESKKSV